MDYAVEFKEVSKYYKGNQEPAVDNVSLAINSGTIVTILGSSGCGKTTLLKMVNRLYEPSKGEIFFYGKKISQLDVQQLRRKIGYVIQQIGLFPHMTITENIAVVPKLLGWEKEKIKQRSIELLDLMQLPFSEYGKRYPHQLSGGQKQRIGLARALAADPPLMLLDEPFGALDPITRKTLQIELLHIQQKSQKTMLFVTHDIKEAFLLGNKVIIMDKGKVVQYATKEEIQDNPVNEFVERLLEI